LDVRVIAASNRDLKTEGEAGRFRPILSTVCDSNRHSTIKDRGDDIRILAEHYIDSFRSRLRKQIDSISPEVLEAFASYHWPGNVRELRNAIERAMILEDGNELR
jgi:DNA-binding NtrC family response regulator